MKYKTAQDMADNLEWLAAFIRKHGHEFPSDYGSYDPQIKLSVNAQTKENLRKAVRALETQGLVHKQINSSFPKIYMKFGENIIVEAWVSDRGEVCTKRVVGTKKVPKKRWVEIPNEFDEEEVVEWDCDPILAN